MKNNILGKETKKALKQAYTAKVAEEDVEDGVFQIKNLINGKIYIGSAKDIRNLKRLNFELNMGSFINAGLQKDWTELGEESFTIEVLDSFKRCDNPMTNSKKLREMLRSWKEKLESSEHKNYY